MEVVIVGNGVSGLLLARALAERGDFARVRVIGPPRPPAARLLSFWSSVPTPFDSDVVAEWAAVSTLNRAGEEVRVPLAQERYKTFAAGAWVARAREALAKRVEFIDARVDAIEDGLGSARVTFAGQTHEVDWVFASGAPVREPDALQRFAGWDLRVTRPPIDRQAARLLDFRTASENDFRFVYALPYADDRLFIEHVSHRPCDHEAALTTYAREVLGLDSWEVLGREQGATPLFRDPPDRGEQHVVRIGVGGGLAKACTGYAVARMWRDAERIARSLTWESHPYAEPPLPSLYRVADHYFFNLLNTNPAGLETLLRQLFDSVGGDGLLSFLDERASALTQAEVARAVPFALAEQP